VAAADFSCIGEGCELAADGLIQSFIPAKVMVKEIGDLLKECDAKKLGTEVYEIVTALYPFCRSITGDGLRESLRTIRKYAPLSLHEIPTGTQVFDWSVPKEWNIRDAYIKNSKGERIVDFRKSNLHVVNYSIPVRGKMRLEELRDHVFTLPETPDLIPYRTSYYKETWGFCLTHRQWQSLLDYEYEVCIDSALEPGHLTIGEFRREGITDDEVVISAHSCHPSLCNDNISSMAVAAKLAQCVAEMRLRYSYRFLWVPATIGTIAWLALNESVIPKIRHGLVLSCVGDPGQFTYKRSRRGTAEIDRAVEVVMRSSRAKCEIRDFSPYGCDERQYCSPGLNLPVGCFMRTPNEEYPENHTSADNLQFVTPEALGDSLYKILSVIEVLENNGRYRNLNPKCEPQLGRRDLYGQLGGKGSRLFEEAIMWVLNFSDGKHSLLDIAERSKVQFGKLAEAAEVLVGVGLLRKAEPSPDH
jgi:aminopeptidase-like protein